jgi:hypothetical protein
MWWSAQGPLKLHIVFLGGEPGATMLGFARCCSVCLFKQWPSTVPKPDPKTLGVVNKIGDQEDTLLEVSFLTVIFANCVALYLAVQHIRLL